MSISLIPSAPAMDTPLEMLEACHERVQAQLGTLGRLAAWLPEHGADEQARQAAANVMRYFDLAAVNHHLDEEQDLIPLLLSRADEPRRPVVRELTDWVLADHQVIFAAWAQIRAHLEPISRGVADPLEAEAVARFAARYHRHIEREEGELLPLARELLGEPDMARLAATMTSRRRQPQGERAEAGAVAPSAEAAEPGA